MKQVNRSTALACQLHRFKPVSVDRGRQFKGDGYLVDVYENSFGTTKAKIFTMSGELATTTYEYCRPREATQQELDDAKAKYIQHTIESAFEWCHQQKEKEKEEKGIQYSMADVERFARNVLVKNHRDMKPAIDEAIPDSRTAPDTVRDTIQWALGLKTKAGYYHGRYCQGGNSYSPTQVVDTALRALRKKDADKLPGFKEAWDMYTTLFHLPNPLNDNPEF